MPTVFDWQCLHRGFIWPPIQSAVGQLVSMAGLSSSPLTVSKGKLLSLVLPASEAYLTVQQVPKGILAGEWSRIGSDRSCKPRGTATTASPLCIPLSLAAECTVTTCTLKQRPRCQFPTMYTTKLLNLLVGSSNGGRLTVSVEK